VLAVVAAVGVVVLATLVLVTVALGLALLAPVEGMLVTTLLGVALGASIVAGGGALTPPLGMPLTPVAVPSVVSAPEQAKSARSSLANTGPQYSSSAQSLIPCASRIMSQIFRHVPPSAPVRQMWSARQSARVSHASPATPVPPVMQSPKRTPEEVSRPTG
jgi:hypothetical protein